MTVLVYALVTAALSLSVWRELRVPVMKLWLRLAWRFSIWRQLRAARRRIDGLPTADEDAGKEAPARRLLSARAIRAKRRRVERRRSIQANRRRLKDIRRARRQRIAHGITFLRAHHAAHAKAGGIGPHAKHAQRKRHAG